MRFHQQQVIVLGSCVLLPLSLLINIYYIFLIDSNQNTLSTATIESLKKEVDRTTVFVDCQTAMSNNTTIPSSFHSINRDMSNTTSPLYWKYFQKLFLHDGSDTTKEQFTIVMPTYQRTSIIRKLIPHYCKTGKYLNKFILVWNDVGAFIPKDISNFVSECAVPFVILTPKMNKLTNRFFPYSEIETNAVFTIDDDRKVLHEDLVFAFQTWQQNRHRILGFEHRTHSVLPDGTYYYGSWKNLDRYISLGYSLLISANFILHKAYLEMYQMDKFIDPGMINFINENFNCEDLAMCLMVADFLANVSYPQTSCVGVKAKHYPYNLEAENHGYGQVYKGLSMRSKHVNERTKCLNYFKKYYTNGILPLHYTNAVFYHNPSTYYDKKGTN